MEQSDFVSTDTEESFSFLLSQAARAVARGLQARLHPYGVTPAQFNVLSCLWEDDALPANVLAERSGFDAPTITGILDRLERQELAVRRRGSGDRRVVLACLTERGSALRSALPDIARAADQAALDGLDPERVAILRHALKQVIANLSDATGR